MRRINFFIAVNILLFLTASAYPAEAPDIALKAASLEALGKIGDVSAIDAMGVYLNDNNFMLRSAAISALARVGTDKAMDLLRDKIDSQNKRIAVQVAAALYKNGEKPAKNIYESGFADEDSAVRFEAINCAQTMLISESIPRIINMLKDGDELVREKAIEALGALGCKSLEAGDAIEKMTDDPNAKIKRSALATLGVIGDKKYIPAVSNRLSDEDEFVVASAKMALVRLSGKDKLLVEKEFGLSITTWQGLREISRNSPLHITDLAVAAEFLDISVIPQIIEDVKSPESTSHLRIAAVLALKKIYANFREGLINQIAKSDIEFDRIKDNIDLVFKIDKKPFAEFFIDALKDKMSPYHNDAPLILAAWQDRSVGLALIQAINLDDKNSDFIINTVYALGELGENSAVSRIEQFLLKK